MHTRKYNGKTVKQPYRKSRRFDKTCRCHGSCSYCRDNRLHSIRKRMLNNFEKEWEE